MKCLLSLAALLACVATPWSALAEETKHPTFGKIERADPRFDKLVPPDAKLELLAEGFDWSEGPVWDREGGFLLFSDIPPNKVMKWKEGEGLSTFLHPAGYTGSKPRGGEPGSNGLLFDKNHKLVLCQHGDRRIARLEDGKFVTVADRCDGKRFNSPNDAVFKSNGDLYFTDPPYGLDEGPDDPDRELPHCGVYRVTPRGEVTLLSTELSRPNGIGLSPDEKTLYVANSDGGRPVWLAFDVKEDGTLGKHRVFFDASPWLKQGLKGSPDGLKVDAAGNVFATAPGGVAVFAPDGTFLGRINTGEATANCAFGDDGKTLYVTADMKLGRIKLNTKGQGF
jgi:gluconolactonase